MSNQLRDQSLCRLALLAFSTFAVVVAFGVAPPKVQACGTCLAETSQAYVYCQHHPRGTEYYGCNFDVTCGPETRSPQEIYNVECVG